MKNFLIKILILLLSNSLFAQENPSSILTSLRNKFNSINDLSADYSQRASGSEIVSGKIYIKKNNKFRVQNKNQILGNDGIYAWNYNATQKKYIITNMEEENNSFFSINYLVNQLPNESVLSARTEGNLKVLELTPKSSNLQLKKIELWINSDNLIQKIVIKDLNNNTNEISLSNYKINQNISDSLFSFNPPEGTKIIDLR
jgi:outer membrane lipoprotein carrier protein